MMNKSKTNKTWPWKVAIFLPLLALLLMAFCKRSENVSEKRILPEKVIATSGIIQKQHQLTDQIIEIKKDGNYIGNKLCSLEEIVKQGQTWNRAGNKWILLLIDESIPYLRIDEVREALANAKSKVYLVTQATVNSDDIVYFAGDVSEFARFSQGEFGDWMNSQLNNYSEVKYKAKWNDWVKSQLKNFPGNESKVWEFGSSYSFIVDKNGKVRDAHIIKASDYPEINAAYEKILTQIPDWEPAMRGSEKVSVYYSFSGGGIRVVTKSKD